MEQTLEVANSSMLWILALAIIGVVLVQAFIFLRIAQSYVKETEIMPAVRTSIRGASPCRQDPQR